MAQYEEVDYNPFEEEDKIAAQSTPQFEEVDYDPFDGKKGEGQTIKQMFDEGANTPEYKITIPEDPKLAERLNQPLPSGLDILRGEPPGPGQLGIPEITQEQLAKHFAGDVPEGVTAEALNKEIEQGYTINLPPTQQLREFRTAINPSIVKLFQKYTPGVDYSNEAPAGFRIKFSQADTEEERKKLIEEVYGEGSFSIDDQGRYLFLNPDTGRKTVIDAEEFNIKDVADVADDFPMVAATLGAAYLSGGSTLAVQLTADLAAGMAAFSASEAVEQLRGANLETFDEITDRAKMEALVTVASFGVGVLGAGVVNRLKSPLAPGVTPETIKVYEDVLELNAIRGARGEPLIKLRPSALNESSMLARIEGLLSRLPGSGDVFARDLKAFDAAIDEEINIITHGIPEGMEKVQMASRIRGNLRKAASGYMDNMRAANNARFTGVDPVTGAEALVEGTEVALRVFKDSSEAKVASMAALVGDTRFIPTKQFKGQIVEYLKKVVRGDPPARGLQGEVIEELTPGIRVDRLHQMLEIPDEISLTTMYSIRSSLGDIVGGRNPSATITEGQAKKLYASFASDIEGVGDTALRGALTNNPISPVDSYTATRFVREFKDFNQYYTKNHDIYNNKKSPINKILKSFNADELANIFVRKNNSENVRLMQQVVSPEKFEKASQAAQDILLENKSGKQILNSIDRLGKKTMDAWFGKEKTKELTRFAKSVAKFEQLPLQKFTKASSDSMDLLNKLVTPNNPQSAIQAKKYLKSVGKEQEWKELQTAFAAKILLQSLDTEGALQGKILLNKLRREYGEDTTRLVLKGTPLHKNLTRLGQLVAANQKRKGTTAGGLAGSFKVLQLMAGKIIKYTKASVGFWTIAKAMTSSTATKWITNKPLKQFDKAMIRAVTESFVKITEGEDTRKKVPSALEQYGKTLELAF